MNRMPCVYSVRLPQWLSDTVRAQAKVAGITPSRYIRDMLEERSCVLPPDTKMKLVAGDTEISLGELVKCGVLVRVVPA